MAARCWGGSVGEKRASAVMNHIHIIPKLESFGYISVYTLFNVAPRATALDETRLSY